MHFGRKTWTALITCILFVAICCGAYWIYRDTIHATKPASKGNSEIPSKGKCPFGFDKEGTPESNDQISLHNGGENVKTPSTKSCCGAGKSNHVSAPTSKSCCKNGSTLNVSNGSGGCPLGFKSTTKIEKNAVRMNKDSDLVNSLLQFSTGSEEDFKDPSAWVTVTATRPKHKIKKQNTLNILTHSTSESSLSSSKSSSSSSESSSSNSELVAVRSETGKEEKLRSNGFDVEAIKAAGFEIPDNIDLSGGDITKCPFHRSFLGKTEENRTPQI